MEPSLSGSFLSNSLKLSLFSPLFSSSVIKLKLTQFLSELSYKLQKVLIDWRIFQKFQEDSRRELTKSTNTNLHLLVCEHGFRGEKAWFDPTHYKHLLKKNQERHGQDIWWVALGAILLHYDILFCHNISNEAIQIMKMVPCYGSLCLLSHVCKLEYQMHKFTHGDEGH